MRRNPEIQRFTIFINGWLCRACAALGVVVMVAAPALAQWQVDAYLGAPFFRGEDIRVHGDDGSAVQLFGDIDDSGEVAGGTRVGYWWSLDAPLDLGLAVDASGVFGELGNADHNFVPVTALIMARLRLVASEEFPGGRLQPYVGAGPSVVWSELDLGLFEDSQVDIGADVRGGVRFGLIGGLGIFGEYRYTYFAPEYEDDLFGLDASARVSLDSSTHHMNFGFSWAF